MEQEDEELIGKWGRFLAQITSILPFLLEAD